MQGFGLPRILDIGGVDRDALHRFRPITRNVALVSLDLLGRSELRP